MFAIRNTVACSQLLIATKLIGGELESARRNFNGRIRSRLHDRRDARAGDLHVTQHEDVALRAQFA